MSLYNQKYNLDKLRDLTVEFKNDKVKWKKDLWITETATIPEDARQPLIIDERTDGTAELVKQNRDKSTLKFDIWQKRPEFVKTMKSVESI